MDGRFAARLAGEWSGNQLLVAADDRFGIELEAEGCPPVNMLKATQLLSPLWEVKHDGSLRNHGVEFVSVPLPPDEVEHAVERLYCTRRMWHPSPRSGVHVHVNVQHWNMGQLRNMLAAYAFVEPFVYKRCGEHREENIFCVPWYRAPQEPENLVSMFRRGDGFFLRHSCKYSALYCGPIRSFGTIEFRHAETFDTGKGLLDWFRMVQRISAARLMEDPINLYSRGDAHSVVRAVLGDMVDDLTDEQINERAHGTGAVDIALLFADPVYRFGDWGTPGNFEVEAAPQPVDEPEPPDAAMDRALREARDLLNRRNIRFAQPNNPDEFLVVDEPPPEDDIDFFADYEEEPEHNDEEDEG